MDIYDLWQFMLFYKNWWLLPIVLVLLLCSGILILSSATSTSTVSPIIYTLF